MPAGAGLRDAVKEVARRASAVARLQAELAKAELAKTGKNAGIGIGLFVAASFIGAVAFALLTALFVVALAYALPLWLSILIVLVVYLIVMRILVAVAQNRLRETKGTPLATEQAKLTFDALGLKRNGDTAQPSSGPDASPAVLPADGGPVGD